MAGTVRSGLIAALAVAASLGGALAMRFLGPGWAAPVLLGLVAGAVAGVLAHGAQSGPAPAPDTAEAQGQAARLAELEAQTGTLRHDLRGILAPALLVGDRLSENADPKIAKAGDTIVRAVNRAAERLARTKQGGSEPEDATGGPAPPAPTPPGPR